MRRALVVGDGGWGTALAIHLARNGLDVALWGHDPEYVSYLATHRANPKYLPGTEIPPSVRIGSDVEALAANADLLVSAVPSEFLRAVWTRHAPLLPPGVPVLSVTKGLEGRTGRRASAVLAEVLPDRPLAVLSGPNIAWEVAEGRPAASVVSSADRALASAVRERLSSGAFRVYSNPDVAGVELGGVLKNVIAVASGMCDGLGLGDNAKAALVTRGVVELSRLGAALGGERGTFFGLSGMGDLMVTCYSRSSRNRTFGERIGRGERPEDVRASMAQIAEGVRSSAPVRDLARLHGLAAPICEEVYLVLHEGKGPRETVESLMLRGRKDETEDLP